MEHRSSDLTRTWDEIRFIDGKNNSNNYFTFIYTFLLSKQIYSYNRTEVRELFGLISPLLVS